MLRCIQLHTRHTTPSSVERTTAGATATPNTPSLTWARHTSLHTGHNTHRRQNLAEGSTASPGDRAPLRSATQLANASRTYRRSQTLPSPHLLLASLSLMSALLVGSPWRNRPHPPPRARRSTHAASPSPLSLCSHEIFSASSIRAALRASLTTAIPLPAARPPPAPFHANTLPGSAGALVGGTPKQRSGAP